MNYQKYIHLLFIQGLMLTPALATATTTEITCPANILTTQQIIATPSGFTSRSSEQPHYLDHLTFYSGSPNDNASLAPDETQKAKSTWIFPKNESVYLGCSYNQTSIELFKALPANLRKCIVDYNLSINGSAGPVPKKILCQF